MTSGVAIRESKAKSKTEAEQKEAALKAAWQPRDGAYASPGADFDDRCAKHADLIIRLPQSAVMIGAKSCYVAHVSVEPPGSVTLDANCEGLVSTVALSKIDEKSLLLRNSQHGRAAGADSNFAIALKRHNAPMWIQRRRSRSSNGLSHAPLLPVVGHRVEAARWSPGLIETHRHHAGQVTAPLICLVIGLHDDALDAMDQFQRAVVVGKRLRRLAPAAIEDRVCGSNPRRRRRLAVAHDPDKDVQRRARV